MPTYTVVSVGQYLTETTAAVYTVSTGATFFGTLGQLCNTDTTAAVSASVEWVNTTGTITPLASNFSIGANKAVSFVAGGLRLPAGAIIQGFASTTAAVAISLFGDEKS